MLWIPRQRYEKTYKARQLYVADTSIRVASCRSLTMDAMESPVKTASRFEGTISAIMYPWKKTTGGECRLKPSAMMCCLLTFTGGNYALQIINVKVAWKTVHDVSCILTMALGFTCHVSHYNFIPYFSPQVWVFVWVMYILRSQIPYMKKKILTSFPLLYVH